MELVFGSKIEWNTGSYDYEIKNFRRSSADHIAEGNEEGDEELTAKLQQLRMDYDGTVPLG